MLEKEGNVVIDAIKKHREKLLFIVSGGVQYLLDIGLFALLVLIAGNNMNINIVSRCGAGAIGFYINGFVVFKSLKDKSFQLVIKAAIKFLLLLGFMTIVSSVLLSFFINLPPSHFIFAKGIIEIGLAIVSFFTQKYLVYGFSTKRKSHL